MSERLPDPPAGQDVTLVHLVLTPEEADGDLPLVCARTGVADAVPTPVWLASSRWWSWLPLAGLSLTALVTGSWGPLASWWAFGALVLPFLASRGAIVRVPLSQGRRARLAALRRRRLGTMLLALLLTWLAGGLWVLLQARVAGLMVLTVVAVLYVAAVGMFVLTRRLGVGGWPEPDGGATLTRVHPAFVDAVELHRTGHRP